MDWMMTLNITDVDLGSDTIYVQGGLMILRLAFALLHFMGPKSLCEGIEFILIYFSSEI
jgi:hypothetical protein